MISAFWRIITGAAKRHGSTLVLIDVGPNLGAINRSALVAADHVVIPLSPDLFSLQGLRNLGPTLRRWRAEWSERLLKNPEPKLALPAGNMEPAGYVVLQHGVRLDRPVRAYDRWIRRIPQVYAESVLGEPTASPPASVVDDPNCLALLKHYHSLVPMGEEQRKPIFHLKPADGALGAHQQAVHRAYGDFRQLADAIIGRVGLAPLDVAVS